MNIKSAVFSLISIKPQPINAIVKKLPYASASIYNAIEEMLKNDNIIKIRTQGIIKLDIPNDYMEWLITSYTLKSSEQQLIPF